jgi:prepilin-type N-terminal cleavage/methylation domain-containing protein
MKAVRNPSRRDGFTLIEVLVVISIIGILASLLLAGVIRYLDKQIDVSNRNDVSQMAIALQAFKKQYGFYPPSVIKLCQYRNDYVMSSQLDQDSVFYITRMFKNIGWAPNPPTGAIPIQWNQYTGGPAIPSSNGPLTNTPNANNGVILEGDQCLAFFLGGIPGTGGQTYGFGTTNPLNPVTSANTASNNIGPFMKFNSARLTQRNFGSMGAKTAAAAGFYSYFDYQKYMPFFYFSPVKTPNSYNTPNLGSAGYALGQAFTLGPDVVQGPTSLAPGTPMTVSVYYKSPAPPPSPFVAGTIYSYWNPDTYQIVCAGRDGVFGPGGYWTNSTAGSYYNAGLGNMIAFSTLSFVNTTTGASYQGSGSDDMVNFTDTTLGVPQ